MKTPARAQSLTSALLEFWQRAADAVEVVDRLLLLQEFATVVVHRHRRAHMVRRARRMRWARWCWVCQRNTPDVQHHIVQVQHGGGTGAGARVCICHGCHAAIHPWLTRDGRLKRVKRGA